MHVLRANNPAPLAAPELTTGPRLTVDLGALIDNYSFLKKHVAPSAFAAVVKADAYGLGMHEVAPALAKSGCKDFFVAWLEEGVALRAALRDERIFVLHGVLPGTAQDAYQNNLIPVINHLGQLEEAASYARKVGKKLPIALHVDSGLNRLGMPQAEYEKLAQNLSLMDGLDLTLILSHLAIPAVAQNPVNAEQLAAFQRALQILPKTKASLAASSGSFLGKEYRFDMVRVGSSLYGMNPVPNKPNPMRAVVTLEFPVLQIQEIPVGQAVGYGCTFKAERVTRLATLGGGFSDGYMRSLSNSGSVWIGDYKCPVVGRVSMDLITVDITDIPNHTIEPGQMVAILHDHYTVNHLAGDAKTRTTEILCSLGRKPKRRYVG